MKWLKTLVLSMRVANSENIFHPKIVPLLVFFSIFVLKRILRLAGLETSRFDGMSIGEINSRVSMSIETSRGLSVRVAIRLLIGILVGFVDLKTLLLHPHLGSVVLGEKIVLAKNGYWFFLIQ